MDWQHRLAPLPGHAYLHELLCAEADSEEFSSRWSGTHAAAAELGIRIDDPVDPVALVAAHDVFGRFVEMQFAAPLSVSAAWGLRDDLRAAVAEAHVRAVDEALAWLGVALRAVPIVAHFPHIIARLPAPEGIPPPQLHTHAVLVAVDIDAPDEDLVSFGSPNQVVPDSARLGFVPDDLDAIAEEIELRYRSAIARRLGVSGVMTDERAEIPEIFARLGSHDYWTPRPCGLGAPGRAVAF